MRTDAEHNRERIVDAYLALVGPANLDPKMDDVATAAGLARVTLYRHFRDRDALRRAAHIRLMDETAAVIHTAVSRDETIEQVLVSVVRDLYGPARTLTMLSTHQEYFDRDIKRRWRQWARPLTALFSAAQQSGALRADQSPELLVDVLLWTIHAVAVSAAPLGRNADPAETVLPLFLNGARAQ